MGISRRKAILGTVAAGGALIIGYGLWPYPQRDKAREALGHSSDNAMLLAWLKVARDNKITIIVNHADMGQGSQTGLAQMLADELDADWNLVGILEAPATDVYANGEMIAGMAASEMGVPQALMPSVNYLAPKLSRLVGLQITGGSASIRATGVAAMRPAGAAAREMFLQAAAISWNVPISQLTTRLSHVHHTASGRSVPYGELIEIAAKLTPPSTPRLKTPDQFTIIGKPVARLDVPDKVTGKTQYGTDTRLDNMKYAAIKHSPVFGGIVETVDDTAVLKMRGVARVVKLDGAVAVVADNTWRAMNAVSALPVTFKGGDSAGLSAEAMYAGFEAAVSGQPESNNHKQGDVEAAFKDAATVIEATYRLPFLAHATMEPLSCTVVAREDGTAEAWAGSQNPLGARNAVAKALGIAADKVTYHNLTMGGGFGRRIETDWITQTAQIAGEMKGTPIKLTWSREEDMQHDKFRPAGVSRFRGALDKDNNPTAWFNVYNWEEGPASACLIPYDIAHQHIGSVDAKAPVPTGAWRSVAHSRHGFFTESFVDEMAHAAKTDPYTFRKKLLATLPRHMAVLDLAATKAGWGIDMPAPEGVRRGRGIALQDAFGSIVCHVAEVSVSADGQIRVDRVVIAADCGEAINPDSAQMQLQGGTIYGLSAALYGGIELQDGKVAQSNFHDYQVVRLADAPRIETHIIRSGAALGGLGEPGTPGITPAVANAVFAATGQRLRAFPFKLEQKTGPQTAKL
jgi:isoquinoline 1-oxidoreductase beta subunit